MARHRAGGRELAIDGHCRALDVRPTPTLHIMQGEMQDATKGESRNKRRCKTTAGSRQAHHCAAPPAFRRPMWRSVGLVPATGVAVCGPGARAGGCGRRCCCGRPIRPTAQPELPSALGGSSTSSIRVVCHVLCAGRWLCGTPILPCAPLLCRCQSAPHPPHPPTPPPTPTHALTCASRWRGRPSRRGFA